jgi:hypothetical protein
MPINYKRKKEKRLTQTAIGFFIAILANTCEGIVHQDTLFIFSTRKNTAVCN